jgi:hypothetical protein
MKTDGWQKRFWANIEAKKRLPFFWGSHDCVMFATSSIEIVTEIDYYAQAQRRYPYSTEIEARELMKQFDGVTGLAASFLGPPIAWGSLSMGDVVVCANIPFIDIEMLCVHDGAQLLAPQKGGGLARIQFRYAMHGWKI